MCPTWMQAVLWMIYFGHSLNILLWKICALEARRSSNKRKREFVSCILYSVQNMLYSVQKDIISHRALTRLKYWWMNTLIEEWISTPSGWCPAHLFSLDALYFLFLWLKIHHTDGINICSVSQWIINCLGLRCCTKISDKGPVAPSSLFTW